MRTRGRLTVPDGGPELETLLADALRPIEPPEDLAGRVEETLSVVTEAAASELSDWADELSGSELAALRDPRNWVRPVVAVAAGGVAGTALVVLELRRRRGASDAAGRIRRVSPGLRGVADSIRSRLD
jgi:hypothetical protein